MKNNHNTTYTIAGLDFQIESEILENAEFSNFQPFKQVNRKETTPIFTMRRGVVPVPEGNPTTSNTVDMGRFDAWIKDEVNIIEFKPLEEHNIYRLQADKYWKNLVIDLGKEKSVYEEKAIGGLIMAAYTYSAAFYGVLMMHASTVKHDDWGVAFVGPSGAGKSTHSQLWLQFIPGISLLNDDQPVLRLVDGKTYIFGSPWSGKTHCYKNDKAQLLAVYRMVQAKENKLLPMNAIRLFSCLLSSCALIKEDILTFNEITQTMAEVSGLIKGYTLNSRPEKDAAILTYEAAKALASLR